MNKRIKKLAEQANELDYETFDEYNHKTVQHYKFNKEKFAELIVQECAAVAGKFVHDNKYKEGGISEFWLKDGIKEHFGVEE